MSTFYLLANNFILFFENAQEYLFYCYMKGFSAVNDLFACEATVSCHIFVYFLIVFCQSIKAGAI